VAGPLREATGGLPPGYWKRLTLLKFALPNLGTGTCPVNTQPIYRLWNRRQDSNHRYAATTAIKQTMIARGWAPEGYGPDAVVMCAPG